VKAAYEFVAGNSVATPLGLAIAVIAALALQHARLAIYTGAVFMLILIVTLAASVFEKPN